MIKKRPFIVRRNMRKAGATRWQALRSFPGW